MMTESEQTLSLHEQVLVEFDLDGRVVGLRAVVVNVVPSALWLGLSRPDSLLEHLAPGRPLTLTFRRDRAAVVASSRFLSHLGSSRSRLFSVKWPAELQSVQRRMNLRLAADCPLQFTILTGEGALTDASGTGRTRNISESGVLFATRFDDEVAFGVDDELEMRIGLGGSAIIAEGRVVRVDEEQPPPGRKPKPGSPAAPTMLVAVHFTSISEGAQDSIVKHLFSLQRQRGDGRKT